jgi:hypothetical protein
LPELVLCPAFAFVSKRCLIYNLQRKQEKAVSAPGVHY